MFALIDCNNFYASCERVFQPHLNGKPIVILSNNDGCVIARSNEAKAPGIPMGAPAFKFKQIFKKHLILKDFRIPTKRGIYCRRKILHMLISQYLYQSTVTKRFFFLAQRKHKNNR